jgi:energy-coupling factor transport system permease protein
MYLSADTHPRRAMFDPRTKLLLALLFGALIIATAQPLWLLAELGAVLLLVLAARQVGAYVRWLGLVALMALSWFAIAWWSLDLHTATTVSLRLVALMSVFFLFFRTTEPEDLGNALVQMGVPYTFAFVMSASLQFVPVISRKAQQVIDAQRARGIPLEPGISALRHYPALLGPLLVQAFQLADDLAESMEARGFSRPERRQVRQHRLHARDWLALAGAVCVLGLIVRIGGML